MSTARVAHIDCTTTGASPPILSAPMSICRVVRRVPACSITANSAPARLMIVTFVRMRFGGRFALLVAHRHRDRGVRESRAGPQRHRDERRLGNFLVGRALLDRTLDMVLDTPGAPRNVPRRHRTRFLALARA